MFGECYLLVTCILCTYGQDLPLVTTSLGKISGVHELSYKGRTFSAFYGIPYALPPLGELRFKEPEPIQRWSGTWKANTSTFACIQIDHWPEPEGGVYKGDEDCLYLNVFVPRKNPSEGKALDVVVHIHGGAFMFSSMNGYAGPKFLMDKDIVLVTFNYRLGIFGFLSTEDEVVPGNNGMKDQVLALKWVKDNIKNFGGNPESVTITGLSVGGASVHYHYLSPLSKGLFNKGISASGNALAIWALQKQPLAKAKFIASTLGCNHKTTYEMISCMRQRSARQIVEITRQLRPWLFNPSSALSVVVEKAGEKPFLPEDPYVLLSQGKINDAPWLASVTSAEGLYPGADFMLKDNFLPDLEKRWSELAPHILHYNFTVPREKMDEVSMKLKKAYLKDEPISKDTYMNLIDMISDGLFTISGEKAAKLQSHVSKFPVYFYYFNYLSDKLDSFTVYYTGQDQKIGVCHGDDIMFLFSNPSKPNIKLTKADEDMQDILLEMWISFIKSGVPAIRNFHWLPVTKDLDKPLEQLRINSPKEIFMEKTDDIQRHRDMWENLVFKHMNRDQIEV